MLCALPLPSLMGLGAALPAPANLGCMCHNVLIDSQRSRLAESVLAYMYKFSFSPSRCYSDSTTSATDCLRSCLTWNSLGPEQDSASTLRHAIPRPRLTHIRWNVAIRCGCAVCGLMNMPHMSFPQQFTTPLDLELAAVIALLVVHLKVGTSLVGQHENTTCRFPVSKKIF